MDRDIEQVVDATATPTLYSLERDVDVSGVSGIGRVAYEVQWPDGTSSVWWPAPGDDVDRPADMGSVTHHPDGGRVLRVHGHNGKTRVVRLP